ncbi:MULTISPECIES: hypothetical protein [unclassified Mesorhizobium]|uniref:hypothetical protein n=1 Tax=Mesorhizobium sp. M7A.F.Ca.CA.001.10.2.1 TaxID=2496720 RepID=UPI0013DFA9A5
MNMAFQKIGIRFSEIAFWLFAAILIVDVLPSVSVRAWRVVGTWAYRAGIALGVQPGAVTDASRGIGIDSCLIVVAE